MELLILPKLMGDGTFDFSEIDGDETFDFAVGISAMKCAAHLTGNKQFLTVCAKCSLARF
jgi:hypothetical protein